MSEKEQKSSFGDKVLSFFETIFNWIVRYPLAAVVTVLVAVGFVAALVLGIHGKINWGGIIGWLFGPSGDEDKIKEANQVPDGRKAEKGESGDQGYEQKKVNPIESDLLNPFRDKSTVRVEGSDGKTKKLKLPEGVHDQDVEAVYEIEPDTYEVKVKNAPEPKDVDALIDAVSSS